jgi:hypothetical protein
MLAVAGPAGRGPWLLLHKASFILWFGVMTIHVLAYAPRLPRLLLQGRARASAAIPGGAARWLLLGASLAGGILVAVLTVHWSAQWGAGAL